MGDNPIQPDPEPTRIARVNGVLGRALVRSVELLRLALTGDKRGRLRRPVLFLVTAAGLGTAPWTLLTIAGLLAVVLLALTDNIVAFGE